MIAQWIVFIGGAANFVGTGLYIKHVLFGAARPNRITFLLWTAAPLIGGIAAVARGATWATVPVFVAAFLPFAILVASFWNPRAYWKLTWKDYFYGALSVMALILWGITNEPNVAIALAILSDLFATLPTVVKAWHHPETEYGPSYIGSSFNGLTGIIAASAFTFEQIAFPIYLFVMMGVIGFVVMIKRR